MRPRRLGFVFVPLLVGAVLAGCATVPTAGTAAKVVPPRVTLERVDIAHYWPFYLDAKERRGAPLDLAFVFAIENPNDFNVMLDGLSFSVVFEPGFTVNTITSYDTMYIPPKKTNHLRVHGIFDAYTTLLSLLVTGGFRLQQMGVKAPDQLKAWWEGIQDFKFTVQVTEGTANFASDQGDTLVAFEGSFPK